MQQTIALIERLILYWKTLKVKINNTDIWRQRGDVIEIFNIVKEIYDKQRAWYEISSSKANKISQNSHSMESSTR